MRRKCRWDSNRLHSRDSGVSLCRSSASVRGTTEVTRVGAKVPLMFFWGRTGRRMPVLPPTSISRQRRAALIHGDPYLVIKIQAEPARAEKIVQSINWEALKGLIKN